MRNTDHKRDSHLWEAGSCYDATSELNKYHPVPGGFMGDGSRAEAVDSWEWEMEGGRRLRKWNMDGLIDRATQSRFGVFVVRGMRTAVIGHRPTDFLSDSINNQTYTALTYMLNMPEPRRRVALQETYGFGGANFTTDRQVHYRNCTVNPSQEVYRWLQLCDDLTYIPEERWKQPVVRFFRCDMLVLFSELEEVVTASGAKPSKDQFQGFCQIGEGRCECTNMNQAGRARNLASLCERVTHKQPYTFDPDQHVYWTTLGVGTSKTDYKARNGFLL